MSALFETTIASRDASTGETKITIKSIHPDSGEPTSEIFFAFQIIAEYLKKTMNPVTKMSFRWTKEERDKYMEDNKPPSEENAPALNDEIAHSDFLEEPWLVQNTTSYIKSSSYDKETNTLTIMPTHPAWTEQCSKVGNSLETAAYQLYAQVPSTAAGPLKPIDRSAPIELEENPLAGFEMRKAKKFREDGNRRGRDGESTATSATSGFGGSFSGFGASGFGQQQQQTSQSGSTTAPGFPGASSAAPPKQEESSASSASGFGGWSKPKAEEKKDGWGDWGSSSSSSSTSNTFGGGDSSSTTGTGFGGTGFGAGFGNNTNNASSTEGEKKKEGETSNNNSTTSTSGFGSGFGSGGSGGFGAAGFGSGGFGAPSSSASPSASSAGFSDPMAQIPDRELPFPTQAAVKYRPIAPLPDIADLVPLPVLYRGGFGSSKDKAFEIGTVVATKTEEVGSEKVVYCVIYSEGEISSMAAQVTLDKIEGRAALMKPRKRIE